MSAKYVVRINDNCRWLQSSREKEKRNEFVLNVKCLELSNTFKSHFMLIKTVCLGSQSSAE